MLQYLSKLLIKQSLDETRMTANKNLSTLYKKPLPSSRSGDLFAAFSYPTKISPEAIAIYIASHTKPGDLILDTFGGSGTSGMATHLCSKPNERTIELSEAIQAPVIWGPRRCVLYELSGIGSFISEVMCNPPEPQEFLDASEELITRCERKLGSIYEIRDDKGNVGVLRYAIWSDHILCPHCGTSISFWDAAVKYDPTRILDDFKCPSCSHVDKTDKAKRHYEDYYDPILEKKVLRRVSTIAKVYGQTGKEKWSRLAIEEDNTDIEDYCSQHIPRSIPHREIPWGDLHRAGYHNGITHLHHFYTSRNLCVMGTLFDEIAKMQRDIRDPLKFLILSYNASHSTKMSRVVVKKGKKDLVLTGAQTGVLYFSNLPVEKNIFLGLRRKRKTMGKAFQSLYGSESKVDVVNASSQEILLPNQSVDYVFTDPPFGGFIPYSELNFINEIWLERVTNHTDEIIISKNQDKTASDYGHMMKEVFEEIHRVLKDTGNMTLVFHSSKAKIWRELQNAYRDSGFEVSISGILDKEQTSYKQTASKVSVKGDPLLLLKKRLTVTNNLRDLTAPEELIDALITAAINTKIEKECTAERIYSRFINCCLENDRVIPYNAPEFYRKVKNRLEKLNAE
jgi:hypothetical protein